MVANAAITPTIQLGEEFKSVADLDGKTFAIVNKAEQKALFGSSAQNLGYDVYSNAFVTTNSGYLWKLVSLADNADESIRGYYMLRLITPSGGEYNIWGSPGFLNTQPADQAVSFILGLTDKNGQDIKNGAVYDVQYVEGQGFSLKNIGTGLYQGANTAPAKNEEPTYFTFATVTTTYVPALKALLAEGEAMKKRGATSAEYDAAIAGIDPDKSADALADAQKVEAALPALAKTQTAAGSDFTRAIANFDCGAKDGWTFEKPLGGNGPDHGGDFEYWAGNASNRAEASFDYWQEITGLPNGTYTVSAEMYNSLNNEGGDYTEFKPTVGVYATVGETTVSKLVDVNSETRVPYVTDEIEVTDGKIRIGAKSFEAPMAARWFTVDNFKLTLVKPAAPEKDDWYTGADFFRFRADKNAAADSPYAAFSGKVEPAWGADPDDPTNGCIICKVPANVNPASQIWMRGTEAGKTIANGSKEGFKITFRVKADGEYNGLESQAHNNWGYKTGGSPFGTLDVTTEWQTVSFVCTGEKAKNDFTDLCFNLSGDAERTFYFDDVEIEEVNKDEWYYQINFAAKDYADPDATYTDGVDFPDAPWAVDGEGNGAIKIVSNAKKSNSYESQFFMQIADLAGGKFNKNDKVILKYKAKAESSNEALTEIQAGGGFHGNYAGNQWKSGATGATIKVGEWTDITTELTITNTDVTNYSLDLTYDAAPITYYFDDFTFEFVKGTDDWYLTNKIYAKDFSKGDETYENGTVFPAASFAFDKDGNGFAQVVSNKDAENDYGSQIFFEIPESLRGGEVELTMKVKASKEISVAAALHSSADGNGWSGNPAGDKVDFKVGEWTEITRVLNTDCKDSKDNPIAYYVLNLSDDKGKEAITYQFDDLSIKKYYAPVEWGDLVEVPVEGTLVTEKDWTKETSYSYWSVDMPEGCTRTIENGIVIENTKTDGDPWANQMFTLDGLTLAEGKEYVLRYTLKINGEGDLRADVGPWGTNLVKAPDTQTLENGYRQVVFGVGPCAQEYTGAHAIWQSRKFLGKIIIEKVELFDITPDYAAKDWSDNILKNGDLKGDDMSEFVLKNNDVEDPEMLLAEKNEYGEIGIETAARPTNEDGSVGGNDYDAQFFVRLPYVLPKGTLFNLEFDVYAEEVNTLAIQAHGEPGQYKANLGSVKTDTSGEGIVHYQKYLSAPEDMRSIAFNLAVETKATYGFSNFKVQIVKDDQAAIDAATADADATTLWPETLALNIAANKGRNTETEGKNYTEESVKALEDAIAAGKAELKKDAAEVTAESLTAATKAIEDAIAGLEEAKPELAYTDLTKEMFFVWSDWTDADATAQAGCAYEVGTSSDMPYGDGSVINYADLSEYATLEVTTTEGTPRFLFNRDVNDGQWNENEADSHLIDNTKGGWSAKYFTSKENGDGSTTYIVDIAALVADKGYAHLHSIKGANWAKTTVTDMKLGYVGEKPALPTIVDPVAINGIAEGASVKDGKYFVNGQIVIVKGGKKFNAAGVEIK